MKIVQEGLFGSARHTNRKRAFKVSRDGDHDEHDMFAGMAGNTRRNMHAVINEARWISGQSLVPLSMVPPLLEDCQ